MFVFQQGAQKQAPKIEEKEPLPTFTQIYNSYASKDYSVAITDSTRLIENNPSAFAYFIRGMSHAAKGDYSPSINDLKESIKMDPNGQNTNTAKSTLATIFYNRALEPYQNEQYSTAAEDFRNAIELAPSVESEFYLGYCYKMMAASAKRGGNKELAKKLYEKAISEFSNTIDILKKMGMTAQDADNLSSLSFAKATEFISSLRLNLNANQLILIGSELTSTKQNLQDLTSK